MAFWNAPLVSVLAGSTARFSPVYMIIIGTLSPEIDVPAALRGEGTALLSSRALLESDRGP